MSVGHSLFFSYKSEQKGSKNSYKKYITDCYTLCQKLDKDDFSKSDTIPLQRVQ